MKSQTLGSALLIAGTSIGAGMLALPLISAATGFWAGLLLMLLTWGLAAYGGLLIAEACRACPEAENLHGMIGQLLGKTGQLVAVVAMLFLYYSLCAAYIAGGASQLNGILARIGIELPYWISPIIVMLSVAIIVFIGTSMVDMCNRVMFCSMLLLLAVIVVSLLPEVKVDNLTMEKATLPVLLAALPVFYTSFGYHCTVPTVVGYVEGCPAKFRKALLLGSLLPFIIYALWNVSTVGILSSSAVGEITRASDPVSSLTDAVGQASLVNSFSLIITAFAALALATSFLGVALGLFDYLSDFSHTSHSGLIGRVKTILLTLLIPMFAAMYFPNGFILALGYAAVALVVLAVFLPVLMAWRVRRLHLEEPYQAPGGNIGLAVATFIGIVIIGAQMGISLGILPLLG